MEEAHYDTPWEFIHRATSFPSKNDRPRSESSETLSSKRIETAFCSTANQTEAVVAPRQSSRNHFVRTSQSPSTNNCRRSRGSQVDSTGHPSNSEESNARVKLSIEKLRETCLNARTVAGRASETGASKRERYREEELIHHGVDRELAERRLADKQLGSFLIRSRHNGSLALSIRASKRILHIKLELRDDRWVLGEGPSFGSVATVVTFYRSHELPIRGAERLVLSTPLLVSPSQSNSFM